MQRFCFAVISVALSDFRNCFEMAMEPSKNARNLSGSNCFSSQLSLLSFLCSLPSALGPEMKPNRWQHGVEKGCPPWRPHLGTCGGLFGSVFVIISYLLSSLLSSLLSPLSSLFTLISSLFSLLSSIFSHLSALFPLLSPLFSLHPSLFSLLSSLFYRCCSFSQIAPRSRFCARRNGPSAPLPINFSLCHTYPGRRNARIG